MLKFLSSFAWYQVSLPIFVSTALMTSISSSAACFSQCFAHTTPTLSSQVSNNEWQYGELKELSKAGMPEKGSNSYVGVDNPVKTIEVWINAFIPNSIPWLTKQVEAGSYAGRTGIMGPPIPFITWNSLYVDDGRMFSSNPNASVRMQSKLVWNLSTGTTPSSSTSLTPSSESRIGATVELNSKSGKVICEKEGLRNVDNLKFKNINVKTLGSSRDENMDTKAFRLTATLDAAMSNRCFRGSPDIDYQGTLQVDISDALSDLQGRYFRLTGVYVFFEGAVDMFPAYEMWASVNGHTPKRLFSVFPNQDSSPSDLFRDANVSVNGEVNWDDEMNAALQHVLPPVFAPQP